MTTIPREQDFYIPPDITVNDDGTIAQIDWQKVQRMQDFNDRALISFTGMGMPPIQYITQSGPMQNGETILDFRLQPRIIQYSIRRNHCSRDEYKDGRAELINLLRPNRQPTKKFQNGRLRKVWPDGTTRDISAVIEQGPAFAARNNSKWDEWSYTETLRFKCVDPTWFDPTLVNVNWDAVTYTGLIFGPYDGNHLIFPDNMVFGTSGVFSGSVAVAYTGTWFAYPVIKIVGPVQSPIIRNLSLGLKIQLDYNVSLGETVTINTAYGNKTIVNNTGTNLIGLISDDTDLNFYIAPDPVVPNGINTLAVLGAGATAGVSDIDVNYYTRYIGI